MQPRSATGALRSQSGLPGQAVKRSVHLALIQTVAILVDQKRSLGPYPKAPVPTFRILPQDFACGRMQGYEAGFPKLRSTNRQNAFAPVHVIGLEIQRLT